MQTGAQERRHEDNVKQEEEAGCGQYHELSSFNIKVKDKENRLIQEEFN